MVLWSSPRPSRMVNQAMGSATFPSPLDYGVQSSSMSALNQEVNSAGPDFAHLILLVFEAVLEVVCVCLPGFIVARSGMFNTSQQKFVANLNVQLFTPCLIFTKLASKLTMSKLAELAIIPAIYLVQIFISFSGAFIVCRLFGFKKRATNFVTAMAVFGNSNSLPISLVISLSKTLDGLHWDKVPGDNDQEVEARGILYLMVFQQLGQLLRWSWGYRVLLAPPEQYADEAEDDEQDERERLEEGRADDTESISSRDRLLGDISDDDFPNEDSPERSHGENDLLKPHPDSDYGSGSAMTRTPAGLSSATLTSLADSNGSLNGKAIDPTPTNGNGVAIRPKKVHRRSGLVRNENETIEHFPHPSPASQMQSKSSGLKAYWIQFKNSLKALGARISTSVGAFARGVFTALPKPLQSILSKVYSATARFFSGLWDFMNPPLWAILAAIIVASIPPLQRELFSHGTFFNNSIVHAVEQSGGVAVPLILVVLGANLAMSTLPREQRLSSGDDPVLERKLLIASLICRMLLPTVCMAPLLALTAKYVPVSILDDPIFIIVCFLLTGAPSALQLAQICQLNNVFMGAVSRLLFSSYVICLLPQTLILVVLALEVVRWAG